MTTQERAALSTRYRKLRIAWSVGWCVVAVLLCVLWVRSYWRHDIIIWTDDSGTFGLQTYLGKLDNYLCDGRVMHTRGWSYLSSPIFDDDDWGDAPQITFLGFGWEVDENEITSTIPFWFLVSACMTVAGCVAVGWSPLKRFSLRTLLLAVTLGSILLGLVVWAVRG